MERPLSSTLEISPGVTLDSRRALWLSESKTIVVSDTHFGHAWVDRSRGHLMPLGAGDSGPELVGGILDEYRPDQLVITGDVVHAASRLKALEEPLVELDAVCRRAGTELRLVLGNHDRGLDGMVTRLGIRASLGRDVSIGRFRFVHGDDAVRGVTSSDPADAYPTGEQESVVVFGHEHPCMTLRGVGQRSARCPCFLVGPKGILMPAFSDRAAGCELGRGRFLGPVAGAMEFECAVLCVGPRLLRVPYPIPPAT